MGDTSTGKTFTADAVSRYDSYSFPVQFFNFSATTDDIAIAVRSRNATLFVIDNADIKLDKPLRSEIAKDTKNQYILFGRNINWLSLGFNSIAELKFDADTSTFELEYPMLYNK